MGKNVETFVKVVDCPHCGSLNTNMIRTSQWAWPMECAWHEGININADMLCLNCDRNFVLSVKALTDQVTFTVKYKDGDSNGD